MLSAQSPADALTDTVPPVVTAVYVRGSNWTSNYLNYLASSGKGSASLGYLMPTGAHQSDILAWGNINTLSIVFSENVTTTQAALSVIGINQPTYNVTGFALNGNVATWTFSQNLPVDSYLFELSSAAVTDLAGNQLDGEWKNGVSTVSGNGIAGGDFNYGVNILPGDTNHDGVVDLTDLTIVAGEWQQSGMGSVGDLSGDGVVDLTDLTMLAADWQVKLPRVLVSSITTDPSASTPTSASTVHYYVTFNRPVIGVDLSDFTFTTIGLTGASITSLTGSGTFYTITVNTGTGTGSLNVSLVDDDSITDLAGYQLGGQGAGNGNFAGPSFNIDRLPPVVTSITTAANSPTNAAAFVYNVTFSESVVGVDASDFALTTTGLTGATIGDVTGSGNSYSVTVQPGSGLGTLALKLSANSTITDLALNPLASGFSSAPINVDTISPVVTGVYLSSTSWSTAFLNYLAGHGLGSATFGYAMPTGANQLRTLPWNNLNQVSIRFSKNVSVTQGALSITGVNLANYTITGFHYDSTNNVATWTLSAPVAADKLLLNVHSGAVRDAANNPLDGEWTDGLSTVSGDGGTGGNFLYRLNVLPGDVNNDGIVQSNDASLVQALIPATTSSGNYNISDDIDADGSITSADVGAINANLGSSLPGANPINPSASLLTDEMFADQTAWNSFSPGGFGAITTGTATRMLLGATTADGDPRGWSAYIDDTFNSYYLDNQSVTDQDSDGYLYGWFKFTSFDRHSGAASQSILAQFLTNSTDFPAVGQLGCDLLIRGDGYLGLGTNGGAVFSTTQLSLNTWYRVAVQWTAGSSYSFSLLLGTESSPLTQVVTDTSYGMTQIHYVGLRNYGYANGGTGSNYLVSGYHVYQTAPLTGVTEPAGLYAPPVGPFTFYIRSDAVGSGDGSANTPQSALTWDEAALYAPIISAAPTHNFDFTSSGQPVDPTLYSAVTLRNMYLAGQVTYAGDRWLLGTNFTGVDTNITVNGEFASVPGQHFTVSAMVTLDGAVATQLDPTHFPNVWVMPSTRQAALFEDGKWMHLAEGASITSPGVETFDSYSSVAAAIQAVPGTFYNDGNFFYFSTFDGAAPSTHTYQRSGIIASTSLSALAIVDGYLHDVTFVGTVLVNTDDSPPQSYGFMTPDTDWTVVNNVATALTGFHAAGSLDTTSNGRLTVMNLTLGPSAPSRNRYGYPSWYDWGGQIPWVSFNGVATATGNQHDLYNINIPLTDGLVGTTTGYANPDISAIYSHNAGTGVQYSQFNITNATLGGGVVLPSDIAFSVLQNVTATGINGYIGTGDNLKTTVEPIVGMGGNFVVTHSLITGTAWMNHNTQGGISFNYCTFDMSNYFDANTSYEPLFANGGNGPTSIHNSIIIGNQHSLYQLCVYLNYTPATLSADYNLYVQNLGSTTFAYQYNNGTTQNISTFQSWQQISGQDAHSQLISSVAALGLDANYVPQAGSPAIGASSDGLAIGAFQPAAPMTPQVAASPTIATAISTTTAPASAPLTDTTITAPAPKTDPLKARAKLFKQKIRR